MAARAESVTRPVSAPSDQAFEGLFVREYRRVVNVALGIVRDPDEAEDIAQDAFTSFHGRHDPSALFAPAWLHRAAAHLALNAVRSRKRRSRREHHVGEAEVRVTPASIAQDPLTGLERQESRQRVRICLARLPKKSAEVLALRYSGLSYAEVAEAMRCGVGDVGTMLRRAEAAFRKEYERETL